MYLSQEIIWTYLAQMILIC
nr:unnamed protein product [Callosobruchus analis]